MTPSGLNIVFAMYDRPTVDDKLNKIGMIMFSVQCGRVVCTSDLQAECDEFCWEISRVLWNRCMSDSHNKTESSRGWSQPAPVDSGGSMVF